MTHDELRDSLPAFALGALDPDERAEVAAHLDDCMKCAAELSALGRVVEYVGLEAAPVTPPAGLRARVLDRVAAEGRAEITPTPARSSGRAQASRPLWNSGLAAAAGVALAIGASIYALGLRSEVASLRDATAAASAQASRLREELATLRRDWIALSRAMDVLKAPDMLRVDLKGQADAPGATARAFWSRTAGLVFTADRLPALPSGRVYQLWTITGTTAASAGIFVPDAAGRASVSAVIPADSPRPDAFGVTIEPAGGSATPTLPIVLMGTS